MSKDKEPVTEEIWLNPHSYRIEKMFVDDNKAKREVEVEYGNYKRVDKQLFPHQTNFARNTKENPIKIKIEYTKITVNKPQQFPFVIPESYKAQK